MDEKNGSSQNTDEKLSDEEFKKLIPHLDLHQLFLIEIENQGTWKNLYNVESICGDKKEIDCAVCTKRVPLTKFEEHIREKVHQDALNAIQKIYHPLFTASRDSNLSDLNKTEIESKTRRANAIAAAIETAGDLEQKNVWSQKKMSLEELFSVEFQKTRDSKWQQMLQSGGALNLKFIKLTCRICERYCVGLYALNDHLHGKPHRKLQTAVFALRALQHKPLNKDELIAYNKSISPNQDALHAISALQNSSSSPKQDQEGLIGVEYVVRIKKPTGEDVYACCLCAPRNLFPTAEIMESHLIGLKHRKRYCEKFYSDTIRRFEKMVKSSGLAFETGMIVVFSKIARGIEKTHYFAKPFQTTYEYYLKERNYVCNLVDGLPHACIDFGPSFSNVVNKDELIAFKKTGGRPLPPKISEARFIKRLPNKHYLNMVKHVSRVLQVNRESDSQQCHGSVSSTSSSTRHAAEPSRDKRSRSKPVSVPSTNSPPPPTYLHYSRKRRLSPTNECGDVWRIYRRQISESAIDLEQAYLEYRTHPEKHPNYDKEWSNFWKNRKTQLQIEGRDYRSYDFQPEWTVYFRQRLEQLFGEQLQNMKTDIRRKLNIPLDIEEDSRFSHADEQRRTFEPPRHRKRELSEKRNVEETATKLLPNSQLHDQVWHPPAQMESERPNIIGLLRLMTALEDHLGSTGDKILDLLTKALSLEKVYAGDSAQLEERILNANNCRLIKSAQEKLRSQLYADLVESKKVKSFNRVIESAEVLLSRANEMGWSSVDEPRNVPPQPSSSSQNIQIEKLIEVLQEKAQCEYNALAEKKKSLPDTLMELMSQKQNNSQPTTHIQPPNTIDHQTNFGMYGNNFTASSVSQNNDFMSQIPFSTENFRNNLVDEAQLNIPNYQMPVNNSDVWNRLGNQTNYLQRNSQSVIDNYGGLNPEPPAATHLLSNTMNPYGDLKVNSGNNTKAYSASGKNNAFGF